MKLALSLRTRAARFWRVLWPVVVVAGGAITCDAPTSPGGLAQIQVRPVFSVSNISRFAGLTIDAARLTVVQISGIDGEIVDTLAVRTMAFPADADSIDARVPVDIDGSSADVTVFIELLAGSTIMFSGSVDMTISVTGSNTAPTNIPVSYEGPGNNVASLQIGPDNPNVVFGGSVPFTVAAFDGQANPVAQYYVSWEVRNSTVHTIDANGVFRAGNAAGTVWVVAETPNNVKDSTQVTVTATPTTPQQISLSLGSGGFLVPLGGSAGLIVTIPTAAPAGGLSIPVTSDTPANLTIVGGPAVIPAGSTRDTLQVNGLAAGTAIITAPATGGFGAATPLPLLVSPSFILLTPPSLNVAVSGTASLGVQLSTAAPAGGTAVSLSSTDPTRVTVTPTVNIAAGQTTGSATVTGVAAGAAAVLAQATGYAAGGSLVTVGAGGTATTLQISLGNNQTAYTNDTVATRLRVRVLDGLGAPVAGATVAFVVSSGGGVITSGAAQVSDASGFATLGGTAPGATWRMGATPGANTVTASVPLSPGVIPVVFTATATPPPPQIVLNVFGSNVVGVGRTGQLDVTLLQPAPAGGLTVSIVSDSTQYLTVAAPGTINFAQGETQHSIIVNGITQSPASPNQGARVRATAAAYTPDTLFIPVSVNLISLPTTLNVPLNQTVSLGITLSTAAPAGGLTVAVSSNSANIAVTTPTVTIAQGATVGQASVRGDALGAATVTATNPNYAPFQSTVTATASLDITQTSINLNASFGLPVVVTLESGGIPVNAPAGGVAVTMTPRNPACAAAASTTIPAGLVSVIVPITYGGSATLPCATYVVASGPAGFVIDSVLANVAIQPILSHGIANLGSGLQRNVAGSLGANNHGGTTVHLVSTDPAVVRLSPDATTPGTASIDIPIPLNGTSFGYYIQGVEGVFADTVAITATAPGFTTLNYDVHIWQPVIDMQGVSPTSTSLDANRAIYARIGTPTTPTGTLNTLDEIRAGGTPVVIRFGLTDSTVARLNGQVAGRADSASATIPVLGSNSPTTFATGGVEFDVLAAGTVATSASGAPVTRSQGTALGVTTTVNAPAVTLGTFNIGSGLQRNISGTLGAGGHGGVTVHLVSNNPSVLLLSTANNVAGTASIDVPVANNVTGYGFYIQGVEGRIADTTTISVTVPGFTSGTGTVRVWQPVIDMQGVQTAETIFDVNRAVYARVGTPTSPTGTLNTLDEVRFGGTPITVRFGLTDSTVARLIQTAPGRADSAVAVIPVLGSNTPTTMATGGLEFDILAAGTVVTSAASPVTRSQGTASGVSTVVTAPQITTPTLNLGSGLQRQVSGNVGATAHGGVTVHVVSADPAAALLSLDAVTPGTAAIDVPVLNGNSTYSFFVQGVEGVLADTSVITATVPGFLTGLGAARIWQPVFDFQGVVASAGSLDADRAIYARIGTGTAPTSTTLSSLDEIRAGGAPLTVTFNSSTATVAQLVTSSTPAASSQTAVIAIGLTNSPTTVATGGVAIDYLTSGQTTLTASIPGFRAGPNDTIPVTVSAPTISVGALTVGSGLQESSSGNLSTGGHSGVDVTVSSSNPSIALIAPNIAAAGQPSIIVHLNPGQTTVSYYVHGVEGVTVAQQVTVRVQAPGFTDGTNTITVVQPALEIVSLATTAAAATVDDAFTVRIGISNAGFTALNTLQEVRFGAPSDLTVTVTSTQPATGALRVIGGSPTVTPSVQVTILRGASSTPTSGNGTPVFDFLAAGQTFIVPTATGFINLQQNVTGTQGFRVVVTP